LALTAHVLIALRIWSLAFEQFK